MSEAMEPFDPNVALKIAEIIGPSSAAAKALVELTERLARGEDVGLFKRGAAFIVGPSVKEGKRE